MCDIVTEPFIYTINHINQVGDRQNSLDFLKFLRALTKLEHLLSKTVLCKLFDSLYICMYTAGHVCDVCHTSSADRRNEYGSLSVCRID